MLAALGMCQVGAIVLMNCKTETTFECTDVVFEKVWIFVKVDSLESELAQPLTSIGVCGRGGSYTAATELATGSVLLYS